MRDIHLLLINPWIYDFKAYDLWMKPLGLFIIASILQREGYKVHFIDCLDRYHRAIPEESRAHSGAFGCGSYLYEELLRPELYREVPRKYKRYGIPLNAFRESLIEVPEPDAILITSSMTYWYPGPFKAVEIVKEHFPGKPVILGGIYCRLCPDHARTYSMSDHVIDSGDINILIHLLSEITGRQKSFHYSSFSDYPEPLYGLNAASHYAPLLTSLGCPFKCTYCATSFLAPVNVAKKPEKIFEELQKVYHETAVRDIAFYDDALLANFEKHLKKLLSLCIDSRMNLRFHAPNALHAGLIDYEAALMLKKAGFHTLRMGYEVADPLAQVQTGAKVTTGDLERAMHNLHRAGFGDGQLGAYIMTGLPGVRFEKIAEAITNVHKMRAMSQIAEFSPLPPTPLWDIFPGSSTPQAQDPLFHNNTYHTYRGTVLPYEEYRELKQLSITLNNELRKKGP
jgi:hypothetical protein